MRHLADVGEEEAFVNGNVGGVLVGGGVGGALVGVPFPAHVRIAAFLLVVSLLLLLPLLVFVSVTFTRNWTFRLAFRTKFKSEKREKQIKQESRRVNTMICFTEVWFQRT
jgi:hypothetical protein